MEDDSKSNTNWFERLLNRFTHEPEDRAELLAQLRAAFDRKIMDQDTLEMIEGVLAFSELTVRDVMIPRSQMDVIRSQDSLEQILPHIIETGHSRFPVVGEDKDDVIGIFLAKDLLRIFQNPTVTISSLLRQAVFIPESKPLNVLLKEFRSLRNHLALVVDEYGNVSGLVTIEDVIEEIIGEIEDEYDLDDDDEQIKPMADGRFLVSALTEIEDFNEFFHCEFSDEESDTIAGFIITQLGHMPHKGDAIQINSLEFTIAKADNRRVHTLIVRNLNLES